MQDTLIYIIGNLVEENADGVGGWGGTCECPDGLTYEVGDMNDGCQTIACINGRKVNCNEHSGGWSNRKVTCARQGDFYLKNIESLLFVLFYLCMMYLLKMYE